MTDRPEIKCPACDGWGSATVKSPSDMMTFRQPDHPCLDCNATGWREMTDDEWSDWNYNNAMKELKR